ncbi:hypothetical protein ACFWIA_21940 [Streptomyces sp. NPDC127068]|uniref:TRADD-N-associated membrane domain-containing protein n=1 Tax=Streptomyces sp. NPDC127068 TaxID=3347127 RepID=UPI003651554B
MSTKRTLWVGATLLSSSLSGVAFAVIAVHEGRPLSESLTIGGAATLATIGLAFAVFTSLDPKEPRQVAEGRMRVRQAEQGLEAALSHPDVPAPRTAVGGVPGLEETEDGATGPDEPAAGRGLALAQLWQLTHSRLDLYHEIATQQARQSFRNAQVAMVIGFVLLTAFVIVALNASTTAGAVVAGALGAVSAALSGFVSSTFVKSQETAAGHLKAYFDQPLEFARYLAAERLVADAGLTAAQRAEVITTLVRAIAAGPQSADSQANVAGDVSS